MGLTSRRRRVPRQVPPTMVEVEYARALSNHVRAAMRAAFAPLLARLPAITAAATVARARRADGGSRLRFDEIDDAQIDEIILEARIELAKRLGVAPLADIAEKFGRRTAAHNKTQVENQARTALGTEVFVPDQRLAERMESWVGDNVRLVKNISNVAAFDIEQIILEGVRKGTSAEELAKQIEAATGVGAERAIRIARDQVKKLNAKINADRQQQLGINRFRWRSMDDGRVRAQHQEFEKRSRAPNGTPFRYDDPPVDKQFGPSLPGEPIGCRCYDEPVYDDILGALTDDDSSAD